MLNRFLEQVFLKVLILYSRDLYLEVLKQEVLDGRYVWEVSLPILVTYVNTERTIPLPMKVTLIVERVSPQDNPAGIAINQFLPVVQGSKVGS